MSKSRYESLKKSNDAPEISAAFNDSDDQAMARKRLVDYFDWLIEAHVQLKRAYKESEEPHEKNLSRLLQLHPMGAGRNQTGSTSIKTKSEDQQ